MLKALYAVILGIFGAGIIHIVILMMIPEFSERDAWSRLAMVSDLYKPTPLETPVEGEPIAQTGDPLITSVACRFDLGDGVVQLRAPGTVPFWSVSVYNRGGQNIYSFNDRTAEAGRMDFVVLTPDQMIDVRKDVPEDFQKSIFVETPIGEGIVVVRAFTPNDSWRKAVADFLGGLTCTLR